MQKCVHIATQRFALLIASTPLRSTLLRVMRAGEWDKVTHFAGASFKPRILPENSPTPNTLAPASAAGDRVHAVLAAVLYDDSQLAPTSTLSIWVVA
jgi:hypothetical protein